MYRGDRWYDLCANKTYAGTVISDAVRLMLSVAVTENIEIQSLDVKTAFLYVSENQCICMRRPAGLTDVDMPAVMLLRKCSFGLPRSETIVRLHCGAWALHQLSPIVACVKKSTLTVLRYTSLYTSMNSALQQVISHL